MRAGRNDPCPCGSGKKYKKCCWDKDLERQSQQTARPVASFDKPARRSGPRSPKEERWEKFTRSSYTGQVELFQLSLEEGILDEDNAESMLDRISPAAIQLGQRERVLELLRGLRQEAPQAFEGNAIRFITWEIENALALGLRDALPELIDELAERADPTSEIFARTVDQLLYNGELDLTLRLLRLAVPIIRETEAFVDWEESDYPEIGMDLEIRAALDADPHLTSDDPDLIQRLVLFAEEPEHDVVAEEVELLAGRMSVSETLADYEWEPEEENEEDWLFGAAWGEEDEDDEDDEDDAIPEQARERLVNLLLAFQGELHRQDGVPWTRSHLACDGLADYLFSRGLGELHASRNPGRIDHPLLPDRRTLDRYLTQCLESFDEMTMPAFAAYEFLPSWLRFLRAHGLLEARRQRTAFAELSPLRHILTRYTEKNRSDPQLGQGLAAWAAPPQE